MRESLPCQGNPDEPADRSFGRQAAGRREGEEAKAGKLRRRDIIPDIASLCALAEQPADEIAPRRSPQ
jgi:hypothetical protein